jgi:hypothetical protein
VSPNDTDTSSNENVGAVGSAGGMGSLPEGVRCHRTQGVYRHRFCAQQVRRIWWFRSVCAGSPFLMRHLTILGVVGSSQQRE